MTTRVDDTIGAGSFLTHMLRPSKLFTRATSAQRLVAAIAARGATITDLAEEVGRFAGRLGIDTIGARRLVADAVIRAGRYSI